LPGTLMLGAASGYLAMLALALRRTNESRMLFDEAVAMNAAMGALPALASTQVNYARMLLRTKSEPDQVKASQILENAVSTGVELGLRPVLQSADKLSGEHGVRSLTDREIDVLKNITTGSSNSRIAADLNISHSTVATHIRHIFRKIGVANRTEAANFARRNSLLDED